MPFLETRHSDLEQARTADLLRILPRGRKSVLDVGARDGYFSALLREYFSEVTALDLRKPDFQIPGVTTVQGDATQLQFADNSFDCVFCAEVLEHIPPVQEACRELLRVAKYNVIVGVPFRQDIRVGRTTCTSCGETNPPWGHVNTFDEARLRSLFPGARVAELSFVGTNREATNALATRLMDVGGNPWGVYQQEESCIHCGAKLMPPPAQRPYWQRVCSALAARINSVQMATMKPHANWIHVVFEKE